MIDYRGYAKIFYRILAAASQFNGNPFRYTVAMCRYLYDITTLVGLERNHNFTLSPKHLYPCLRDWTAETPLEPTYFYQDSWAAGKIFKLHPEHHYDVGSSAMTVGIISQFVSTTMIDIRPIDLELPNLNFCKGSILALPFSDGSIESLSSLCVVEHIGLGRYGDSVDPWGSEKAIRELKRVLKPGGDLFISLPIDGECRVYFNAHRAFTREYVIELLNGCELVEEKYIYGTTLCGNYEGVRGFGTGLFHVRKDFQ